MGVTQTLQTRARRKGPARGGPSREDRRRGPAHAPDIPVPALLARVAASVKQDLVRAVTFTLLNSVAGSVWCPRVARYLVYRLLGMDVRTAKLGWNVTFFSRDVSIRRNALVQWGVVFEGGPITIGENTMVAHQVAFITADHPRDEHGRASLWYTPRPIEVGRDCWLGARVTVLGGVRIADGCVVGAGSTVTRDLTEPGVYAGSPARLVKPAPDYRPREPVGSPDPVGLVEPVPLIPAGLRDPGSR